MLEKQEPKIFCIIPAFNEEKTIINVVSGVKPLVNEVVVVDDGSSDRTYELAQRLGVVVLRHFINRGQGAALQTGNKYALARGANIIIHFDADGQFVAEEIKDIIRPLINGRADIVFGSRFLDKKSRIPWRKKYVILPIARLVNLLFFGVSLTDPQSGFRALSAKAASAITIEHDRMAHCSEIMMKSSAAGLRIKEVPITVIYNRFGQKFSGGLKILRDLFWAKLVSDK